MSARDDMAGIKGRAEKFLIAYAEMLRIDQGIGGLAVKRPDLMPDFDAWWLASDVEHADTVLAVIEALKPRTITTREDVEALGEGAVIVDTCGDVAERRDGLWCSYETSPMSDHRMAKYLPATLLREGTPA